MIGSEVNFSKLLEEHGCRAIPDYLVGFRIDTEKFLTDTELFKIISVRNTPEDSNCMIAVICLPTTKTNRTRAIEEMRTIWSTKLRYEQFEQHYIQETEDGFKFYFITMRGEFGITGVIEFRGCIP